MLRKGENTPIFRKQLEFVRIIDTFVEIIVRKIDVKANFRKSVNIESP